MNKHFRLKSIVGRGAQNIVGRLEDDDRLIKFPHWTGARWDKSSAKSILGDLGIHLRRSNPIPETSVVTEPTIDFGRKIIKPPFAVLAEEIRGKALREADLVNPDIKDQFSTLIKTSLAIREETGSGVDFMGFESIGHLFEYFLGKISADQLAACNILIDSRGQIKLIDTSLLSPARAPFGVGWAIDFLIDVQHGLMAEVLQDQELLGKCSTDNHSRLMTKLAEKVYQLSRSQDPEKLPDLRSPRHQNLLNANHALPLHGLHPGVQ